MRLVEQGAKTIRMLGWILVILIILLWVIIPIGQSIAGIETIEQGILALKQVF
jgi:hypothetical protein